MPERRNEPRSESPDRRTFPRPPLWLNLGLLCLAFALFAYARHQRGVVQERTATLFQPTPNSPAELDRIRQELSRMELTQDQLAREIDGRTNYLQSLQHEQFYIAIDTEKKKLYLRLGPEVAREADVQVGPAATITSAGGKTWTFVPVKGSFTVSGKEAGYPWRVPEWWYAMDRKPAPAERPVIENGLGKYVVFLQDSYVIHSPPPPESPLSGRPKPGSFMISEEDLAAIWPRLTNQTRVYIF